MYFQNFFYDYLSLFSNPASLLKKKFKLKESFWYVFHSIWFSLVIGAILSTSSYLISRAVGYNTEANSEVFKLVTTAPFGQILLLTTIIAPLAEEACFRLLLSTNKTMLSGGLFLMLLFVYSRVQLNGVFIILAIITLPLIWIAILTPQKVVTQMVEENLRALMLFSTAIFALSHLVNFNNFDQFWYLIPILVMTQFFSGTVYSFMKLRFGFEYAILSHALFNGVIVTYLQIMGPFYLFG